MVLNLKISLIKINYWNLHKPQLNSTFNFQHTPNIQLNRSIDFSSIEIENYKKKIYTYKYTMTTSTLDEKYNDNNNNNNNNNNNDNMDALLVRIQNAFALQAELFAHPQLQSRFMTHFYNKCKTKAFPMDNNMPMDVQRVVTACDAQHLPFTLHKVASGNTA